MYRRIVILLLLVLLVSCDNDIITSPSENLTDIEVFNVYADPDALSHLRTNKVVNTEIPMNFVHAGHGYTGILRSSGSGSRYHARWGFKMVITDGDVAGVKEFNLSSQVFDPSAMHTYLAVALYKSAGLITHNTFPVFLRINDEDEGLYPFVERIDTAFFNRRNISYHELYKLSFDTKFIFDEGYIPEYVVDKEIPDNDNYSSLYRFMEALDTVKTENIETGLNKWIDIENYLTYHALTSLLNNYDAFTNNFYLFRSTSKSPFQILPWDFDKCFTRSTNVGAVGDNDIIRVLFRSESVREKYKNIMVNLVQNYFNETYLFPLIDFYSSRIREAYHLDPFLGKLGRYNFDYEITQLKAFISSRYDNIRQELDNL